MNPQMINLLSMASYLYISYSKKLKKYLRGMRAGFKVHQLAELLVGTLLSPWDSLSQVCGGHEFLPASAGRWEADTWKDKQLTSAAANDGDFGNDIISGCLRSWVCRCPSLLRPRCAQRSKSYRFSHEERMARMIGHSGPGNLTPICRADYELCLGRAKWAEHYVVENIL